MQSRPFLALSLSLSLVGFAHLHPLPSLAQSAEAEGPCCQSREGRNVAPAESCESVPAQVSLTGTLSYRERVALHPDAIATVTLIARDRPTAPIATQTIAVAGRQVPLPFTLTYDPATLIPGEAYVIEARITLNGGLRFTGSQAIALEPAPPTDPIPVLLQLAWGRLGR